MTTPSKYTINQALALIAITNGDHYRSGLHVNTRIALYDYLAWEDYHIRIGGEPVKLSRKVLNDAGWERARQSRLWKAHQWLTDRGWELNRNRTAKVSHISYYNPNEPQDDYAFTGGHGRVYVKEPGAHRAELVEEFRNGTDTRVAYEYSRPDEVAECTDELPRGLYTKLWSFVEDYDEGNRDEDNPMGVDYPGELSETNKMPQFWDRLTADEQQTLRDLDRQDAVTWSTHHVDRRASQ